MKIVNADGVRASLSMIECIDAMVTAMTAVGTNDLSMPTRLMMPLVDESAHFAVMPGSLSNPRVYGAKVIGLHADNPTQGRPAIQGFVVLFDHDTGTPLALADGAAITTLRTGAVSGLATRLLARPDSRTLGLFGYGVQAAAHLEAVCAVRQIAEVRVWGRSLEKARAFCEQHAATFGPKIIPVTDPREAADADIVCTATSSTEPILCGEWVKPGTHVNLVGAYTSCTREADSALIAAGRLYVDSLDSAFAEAGDILIPIEEGVIGPDHIVGELGALQLGRIQGRSSAADITIFKSLGLVVEDLVAAHAAYMRT